MRSNLKMMCLRLLAAGLLGMCVASSALGTENDGATFEDSSQSEPIEEIRDLYSGTNFIDATSFKLIFPPDFATKSTAVYHGLRAKLPVRSRWHFYLLFSHLRGGVQMKGPEEPVAAAVRARGADIEYCVHSNNSLPLGSCPGNKWHRGGEAFKRNLFDAAYLDIVVPEWAPSSSVDVTLQEVTQPNRIGCFALGTLLMLLADVLSRSVLFYYSTGIGLGIFAIVIIIAYKSMKLLPTGRRGSLQIFFYGLLGGLGTLLLHSAQRLSDAISSSMGLDQGGASPLLIAVIVLVVFVGAALGFFVVKRFVLTAEGQLDTPTVVFVACCLKIIAAVLLLFSSDDPPLAISTAVSVSLLPFLASQSGPLLTLSRILIQRRQLRDDPASVEARAPKTPERTPLAADSPSPLRAARGGIGQMLHGFEDTGPKFDYVNASPLLRQVFASSSTASPNTRLISRYDVKTVQEETTRQAMKDLYSDPALLRYLVENSERVNLSFGLLSKREQRSAEEIEATAAMDAEEGF